MNSLRTADPTLISIFEAEVSEGVGTFHEHLLHIERVAPDRQRRLEELLRLAHDLKGSARVVGYEIVARLAHALEHRLLTWRRQERVAAADIDLALGASDSLRALVLDPRDEVLAALAESQIDDLESPLDPAPGAPAPGAPASGAAPGPAAGPASSPASSPALAPMQAFAPVPVAGCSQQGDTLRLSRASIDSVAEDVATTLFDSQRAVDSLESVTRALGALEAVRLPRAGAGARETARTCGELRTAMARLRASCTELRDTLRQSQNDVRTLDDHARALCLVPATPLIVHLERVVRDAAAALGRRVEMAVEGRELHVDMLVLEALKAPLTHALRNAVDHGVESPAEREAAGKPPAATVRLRLLEEGDRLHVVVEDDGRGIDRAAVRARLGDRAAGLDDRQLLQALLRSGLSTREHVTQLSGRGLGLGTLAVVADQLRGDVELASTPGAGSTLTLMLPRRLSLLEGLVVEAGGNSYVVPISGLSENSGTCTEGRGLAELLGLPPAPTGTGEARERGVRSIRLKGRDEDVVILVDRVSEPVEVVRRSVGAHLGRVTFMEGATILPTGEPAFILDARAIATACGGASLSRAADGSCRRRVLLVDDSPTLRAKLHHDLTEAGFDVVLADDGVMALERLAVEPCDAVVTDVQMPRLDGFQLLARLTPQVPVVLITAWPDRVAEARAHEQGAVAYIPKDDHLTERLVTALHSIPALRPEPAP
jgi:chemotaxis protein histidine kinase CheA